MIFALRSRPRGKAVTPKRHDGTTIGEDVEHGELLMAMPRPLCFPLPWLDEADDIRRSFVRSARS